MKLTQKVSVIALAGAFALALAGPSTALAATSPTLGAAESYSVLASTYTNTVAGTTITGDIGFTTGPAVAPTGVHTNYGSGTPYSTAGTDQGVALVALNSQACDFTFADGAVNLSTDDTVVSHGTAGTYAPGVYCTGAASAASIGTAGITLVGSGTYIFKIYGALTTVANSAVRLTGGASACDVFWVPTAATTLGANTTFAGTDIDASGITIGSTVTWTGRALAFGGTVSTDVDTITTGTCSATVTAAEAAAVTAAAATAAAATAAAATAAAAAPALPDTGVGPANNSGMPWNIIISAGILIALSSLYLARKKQTSSSKY